MYDVCFLLSLLQNEVNDIPFFDIELPYELALKIFQYLNCTELGRCAQVSGRGEITPAYMQKQKLSLSSNQLP